MRSIAKVFGRSPFVPLQMHMEKVAECVNQLPELIKAFHQEDMDKVETLMQKISRLEHEADNIKHDVTNNLPRGLFMPVERINLLGILNTQDHIAGRAENIAVLMSMKKAKSFDKFDVLFDEFVTKSLESFKLARSIIDKLDELLETGFGGIEAQSVRETTDMVAFKEHEADVTQKKLLQLLLNNEDKISYGDFFLWTRILRQVGGLADRSEELALSVRMTLESR